MSATTCTLQLPHGCMLAARGDLKVHGMVISLAMMQSQLKHDA